MFNITFHAPVEKGQYVGINHASEVFDKTFAESSIVRLINIKISVVEKSVSKTTVDYIEPVYSTPVYDKLIFHEPVSVDEILPVYSAYNHAQVPLCSFCRAYPASHYVEYENPDRRPVYICGHHYSWVKDKK